MTSGHSQAESKVLETHSSHFQMLEELRQNARGLGSLPSSEIASFLTTPCMVEEVKGPLRVFHQNVSSILRTLCPEPINFWKIPLDKFMGDTNAPVERQTPKSCSSMSDVRGFMWFFPSSFAAYQTPLSWAGSTPCLQLFLFVVPRLWHLQQHLGSRTKSWLHFHSFMQ